jgi:hypothetical protein
MLARNLENHRQPWTPQQVEQLRHLAQQDVPLRVLALELGRTSEAIQVKASAHGISLNRTNATANEAGPR